VTEVYAIVGGGAPVRSVTPGRRRTKEVEQDKLGSNLEAKTMKATRNILMGLMISWTGTSLALAGQASSGASAASNGRGPGTAAAEAAYTGNGIGVTKTNARSGNRLNLARGTSIGFDGTGLSFSNSYAVAAKFGPAVAGTLNLRVGTDGRVTGSVGRTVASGDRHREVSARGSTGNSRRGAPASAAVRGFAGRRGHVKAVSRSFDHRPVRRQAVRTFRRPGRSFRR